MACLYINSKGQPWRRHSYSAGLDFDKSALGYYLRRVLGWREKDDKAAFKFGRALEESIQFHHDNNGLGAVEDFVARWTVHKDEPLKFTATEKDWANLLKVGIEMIRLYQIRQPSLPIPLGGQTVFQREYAKFMFEDPELADLEFAGKIDIVSYVDPGHPLLPKLDWKPEYGVVRPCLVDIKTSAIDLGESQGLAAFDKQLRVYSWLTGIRDVSLLWFKKTGIGYKKGSSVTLLEAAGALNPGDEAVVAKTGENGAWLVRNDYMLQLMDEAQGKKADGSTDQTKLAKEKALAWLDQNSVFVPDSAITRQRLQFNSGFVSHESAEDAGLNAARQMLGIVNCWKTKKWPNTYGIRFPTDDRRDPYFRAFVLKDEMFKSQNFTQTDTDDLFDDGEEAE